MMMTTDSYYLFGLITRYLTIHDTMRYEMVMRIGLRGDVIEAACV